MLNVITTIIILIIIMFINVNRRCWETKLIFLLFKKNKERKKKLNKKQNRKMRRKYNTEFKKD